MMRSNTGLARWSLLCMLLLLAACTLPVGEPLHLSGERGIGGTGRLADERGVGGTGRREDERGVGGTGRMAGERGIGGTGIIGTLTAFGSIWVNGLHVHYDTDTRILSDGEPVSSDHLRLDQWLLVSAYPANDGALRAGEIEIRHEVIGPLESTPDAAGIARIMGQRVDVSELESLPETIHVGDWLEVSGLRDSDGVIRASRIDTLADTESALLRGVPKRTSEGDWQLDGLALVFAPGEEPVEPCPQLLRGRFDGASLRVTASRSIDELPFAAGVEHLSIEVRTVRDAAGRLRLESHYPLRLELPPQSPATSGRLLLEMTRKPTGVRLERALPPPRPPLPPAERAITLPLEPLRPQHVRPVERPQPPRVERPEPPPRSAMPPPRPPRLLRP